MKGNTPQFAYTPEISQALQKLNPSNTLHNWQHPCTFLQPLFRLGIAHLSELAEQDGKHIITGKELRARYGRRRVQQRHVVALNRLAILLNEGPGADKDTYEILRGKNSSTNLDKHLREMHRDNMHITALATNPTPTFIPFPAPLHPDQRLITKYLQDKGQGETAPREGRREEAQRDQEDTENHPRREQRNNRGSWRRDPTLHRDKKQKPSLRRQEAKDCGQAAVNQHICRCNTHTHKKEQARNIFTKATGRQSKGERAANVIQSLYGHSQHVDRIEGWRMVTDRSKHGDRTEKITQIQYLVRWKPSIIDKWALMYHQL
jgi:hypothetical protein